MKRTLRVVVGGLLIVAVVLSLGSCLSLFGWALPSQFTVDNTDYELGQFYVMEYGEVDTGLYAHALVLVSPNSSFDPGTGPGTGADYVVAYLISDSTELIAGTYEYSDSATAASDTVVLAGFVVGLGTDAEDSGYATDGTVTVVKQLFGGYVIQLDLSTTTGDVTGQYVGDIDHTYTESELASRVGSFLD